MEFKTHVLFKSAWKCSWLQHMSTQKPQLLPVSLHSTLLPMSAPPQLQELCSTVMSTVGGLDDLELSLNKFKDSLTSSLVAQAIDSSKHEAHARRLLSNGYILMGDIKKEGRVMDAQTFGLVADSLVKLGKEDEALGIFKNLEKYKCPIDEFTATAIINALCSKGHAKRAEGVVWHHKDKITSTKACIYRSLLYGWSVQRNVKEARRIIKEMKADGVVPNLICYNTFLRCLCEQNLKHNPSGLVPKDLNVMMEMRSYKVFPTLSYNILLSCLGKTRRVKESCQILETMKNSDCTPDWISNYLVAWVVFLSGRFGKGKEVVDQMIGEGLVPNHKFYYSLIGILCGVERVNHALELFEKMKRSSLEGYRPVYDVLIPKLCRGGDFGKGKELWDEATCMGITLQCSRDVLDPSLTEVYKPRRPEKISLADSSVAKSPQKITKYVGKMKMRKNALQRRRKRNQIHVISLTFVSPTILCQMTISLDHYTVYDQPGQLGRGKWEKLGAVLLVLRVS
ncbi:hypothetical protein RJT34_19853 [Clitoria ternatea]|uniref:Pentatricopeptide repeat-containing protein n=1 Tax=Clitoria ternatea TaxID=43366 RepID=A0AAN9P4A0_CLITE